MLNNNLDIAGMEDDELIEKEQELWDSLVEILLKENQRQLLLDYANVQYELTKREDQ